MNINYMVCTIFYKCFHKFLGLKNKAFEIQIANTGWYWWYFGCNRRYKTDHAGFELDISILGIDFFFDFYDYRHWNKEENRFYFDEEPAFSWIGYKGYTEQDYWKDIEKTSKIHNLDGNYLTRCRAVFAKYKKAQEEYEKHKPEPEEEEDEPFVLDPNIPWHTMAKAKDWRGRTLKLQFIDNEKVKVIGCRKSEIYKLEYMISFYDIYDKRGKLLSKKRD